MPFEIIEPSDYYVCIDTYFKEDFSEVCKFTLLDGDLDVSNALSGKDLKLDLLVDKVTIPFSEHHKIIPHIGDTFSIHFYGRAPLIINFQGMLIDSTDTYGKAHLIQLYRDVLRVKAVARTGVAPLLLFPGVAVQGAITNMTIIEGSDNQTGVMVSMSMLVLRLLGNAPDNDGVKSVLYDYTVGPDVPDKSDKPETEYLSGKDHGSISVDFGDGLVGDIKQQAMDSMGVAGDLQQQAMDSLGIPQVQDTLGTVTSAASEAVSAAGKASNVYALVEPIKRLDVNYA